MRLQPILRAHGFMRTEAPPQLWEAATADVLFLPLLGEMIAAALRPGSPLSALTLSTANVVVTPEAAVGMTPASGEYVAVSVLGPGAWTGDWRWLPAGPTPAGLPFPAGRLTEARAHFAYGRALAAGSSVTVFLGRQVDEPA
jgi:hypothetical protein